MAPGLLPGVFVSFEGSVVMKKIGTGSNAVNKGVGQTPFERSLARRIAKARLVLDLSRKAATRENGREAGLIMELHTQLERFGALNSTYIYTLEKYVETSLARRALFKGQTDSIKHVAQALKEAVMRDKSQDANRVAEVRALYAPVFAQNPLAPPYDITRPGFERELDIFMLSYTIILDAFRALVKKAAESNIALPFASDVCESLIVRSGTLGKQVESLLQKVYVLNDERLQVFDRIKELCNAICSRSRYLFGSHDPIYKEINTLKYAIM